MRVHENFSDGYSKHWTQVTTGGGYVRGADTGLRMGYDSADERTYTDAQIDDYTMLSKRHYLWKPPLKMSVRARFSGPGIGQEPADAADTLKGTAGFGFWNKPFTMQGQWFTAPEAIWFFYSAPPSNMALVPGVAGWGWKAQVVRASLGKAAAVGVPLAIGAGLSRLTNSDRPAARLFKAFTGASEHLVTQNMTDWHDYELTWKADSASFSVDGEQILSTKRVPRGPLGFVMWLDNEYAVATPRGELRFGKTDAAAQWLDAASLTIERL